jgi:hypothetical protein
MDRPQIGLDQRLREEDCVPPLKPGVGEDLGAAARETRVIDRCGRTCGIADRTQTRTSLDRDPL